MPEHSARDEGLAKRQGGPSPLQFYTSRPLRKVRQKGRLGPPGRPHGLFQVNFRDEVRDNLYFGKLVRAFQDFFDTNL